MPEVTRRDVLRLSAVVAGAAALAACTSGGGQPAPTDPGGPEDPDRGLRAEIGRSEAALIALYAAAVPRLDGALAAKVATLGERHPAYRQAIDPDRLGDATPTPDEGGSASPQQQPSTPAPTLPSSPEAVLTVLREAETAAAEDRARQAVSATDGELARVIVLAGAGSAAAAQVLRRAGA